jgi:hypothetical protein
MTERAEEAAEKLCVSGVMINQLKEGLRHAVPTFT